MAIDRGSLLRMLAVSIVLSITMATVTLRLLRGHGRSGARG